jgi:hypothetical protein
LELLQADWLSNEKALEFYLLAREVAIGLVIGSIVGPLIGLVLLISAERSKEKK